MTKSRILLLLVVVVCTALLYMLPRYVVNNDTVENGGQTYDIYIKGGEFSNQQAVYENAKFRMKRTLPLTHFITIANTGPAKAPYGNGGLRYDDIYMVKGRVITTP